VPSLKVESAVLAACTICIFFAFYFAFLSFQLVDDTLKKQSVTFAAYSIITGVVLMACFMVYLVIKKALLKNVEANP
jgi:TRAP-type C4-dicarboxylate transport system permease small subunit